MQRVRILNFGQRIDGPTENGRITSFSARFSERVKPPFVLIMSPAWRTYGIFFHQEFLKITKFTTIAGIFIILLTAFHCIFEGSNPVNEIIKTQIPQEILNWQYITPLVPFSMARKFVSERVDGNLKGDLSIKSFKWKVFFEK